MTEQRSHLALEAAAIGVWSWDVISDILELDSRSKALFGLPETEPRVTLETLFSHLHPDDRKSTEEAIKRFLQTRAHYDVIHRVISSDNTVHLVRCQGRFLAGANSTQVLGVVMAVPWLQRSEEEHHKMEDKLRRVNDELESRVFERTAELERTMARVVEQSKLLDLANDAIFVRGADDRISYWNEGAERLYGWTSKEALGQSTHDLLRTVFPIPASEIMKRDRWEGELQHTRRDGTVITVESRWTTLWNAQKRPMGWLELNTDISSRKESQEAAVRLSTHILRLQDEERRRMGRELHDGLGQYLAILKLNLDVLTMELTEEQRGTKFAERLSECSEVIDKCIQETRTFSHLLHPPLLDEAGFPSAARWYVEGFAKRSNLRVDVDIPSGLPRLPGNAELALFRVLQECLTNVYRHSGCSAVEVLIQSDAEQVTLRVKDNGRGVPEGPLQSFREGRGELGIGLAGMRERLRQLSGRLEVHSSNAGTTVTAIVPYSPASESVTEDASRRADSAA